jgi:2-polyprenyl-3-methyl-5-hydroxy-6-metoxy-1,4-benzoquinol methylase
VAKKVAKYVLGIDFSLEGISLAKENHKDKNLNFEHLDVKDICEKFDVIVSIGTLEHMDDPLMKLKLLKNI